MGMKTTIKTTRLIWSAVPLLAFGLAGCLGEEVDDLVEDDCEGYIEVLGTAGQVTHQTLAFDWQTREEDADGEFFSLNKPLRFLVPGDARSVVVTLNEPGATPVLAEIALNSYPVFTLFDDRTRPPLSKGIYAWDDVVSAILPSNEKSAPGNRCLDIFPGLIGGSFSKEATLDVVTNRLPTPATPGFDVNVIVVGETGLGNENIIAVLEATSALFRAGNGPQIRNYTIERLTGPETLVLESAEFRSLVALESAPERAVPIVLVNNLILDELDDDLVLLGIAGGIPAAPYQGTRGSSLVVAVEPHTFQQGGSTLLSTSMFSSTIAHELGHMFGLFHTTEQDGEEHDPIGDTPQCTLEGRDANENDRVDVEECQGAGADNLMFWGADEGSPGLLSATQSMILRNHPLVY